MKRYRAFLVTPAARPDLAQVYWAERKGQAQSMAFLDLPCACLRRSLQRSTNLLNAMNNPTIHQRFVVSIVFRKDDDGFDLSDLTQLLEDLYPFAWTGRRDEVNHYSFIGTFDHVALLPTSVQIALTDLLLSSVESNIPLDGQPTVHVSYQQDHETTPTIYHKISFSAYE